MELMFLLLVLAATVATGGLLYYMKCEPKTYEHTIMWDNQQITMMVNSKNKKHADESAMVLTYLSIVAASTMEFAIYKYGTDPQIQRAYSYFKYHFDPEHMIYETYPGYFDDNTSYTINKDRIYLCLRDEKYNIHDLNILVMVALHELTHFIITDEQHTTEFWRVFYILMNCASDIGAYTKGKITNPIQYCSNITISGDPAGMR